MIHFAWFWLALLTPLPWLIRYFCKPVKTVRPSLQLAVYANIAETETPPSGTAPWLKVIAVIAWLALVAACCRPQWVGDPIAQPRQGRDLMMAVDLSGSMQIPDMVLNGESVDRLTMVKHVLSQFIAQRAGDRLGLVLFADAAYLQTPLTFDQQTVSKMLHEAVLGLVGTQTAIGEAIGLSLKHMMKHKANSKVLILLTDGKNNAGSLSPLAAAKLAAKEDIKIYTIGMGADQMTQQTLFGTRRVDPSRDLDEKTLQQIAKITGGKYFRARDGESLSEIYELIDQLEPVTSDKNYVRPRTDLFYWPLLAAVLLSMLIVGWRLLPQPRQTS